MDSYTDQVKRNTFMDNCERAKRVSQKMYRLCFKKKSMFINILLGICTFIYILYVPKRPFKLIVIPRSFKLLGYTDLKLKQL